jgi:hypothetical protein
LKLVVLPYTLSLAIALIGVGGFHTDLHDATEAQIPVANLLAHVFEYCTSARREVWQYCTKLPYGGLVYSAQ